MIEIKLAESIEELEQILILQSNNLIQNVPAEKRKANGFLTAQHSIDILQKMQNAAPQIIAIQNQQVVGYALVMLKELSHILPVLVPMFEMFEKLEYKQISLTKHNYYVMGQICVDETVRGEGIFEAMYLKHKEIYSDKFDICLTEVSSSNARSMRAHEKVGFKVLHTFIDKTDTWNILIWDWKVSSFELA